MVAHKEHPDVNVIIPARGGSKGIPRKNMQLVAGIPLIGHTIRAALDAGLPGRVFVSSEDEEILGWSRLFGAETLARPPHIADDASPLAEVAAYHCEQEKWTGAVAVFQPTSPLRSATSIKAAWAEFERSGVGSLGSVVTERHNLWHSKTGNPEDASPVFAERVNRQYQTEAIFRENGAIQFVSVEHLLANRSMIAPDHALFELPPQEGLDIDQPEDLMLARRWMIDASILLRVRANRTVGSGHLFRCIQLAQALSQYDIAFSLVDCDDFVAERLDDLGYTWETEDSLQATLETHATRERRLVINDVLDTSVAEVALQRSLGYRVVSLEDLGDGASLADWVVNALYVQSEDALPHVVSGVRYATLRPEFSALPGRETRAQPERVLVTFGGTDPAGLSSRVSTCLSGLDEVDVRIVLGPGVSEQTFPKDADVVYSTSSMAAEMAAADLVVTSAGRTVFEAASMGTPVVVIAQNVREATHSHLDYEFGVIFLGLASLVEDGEIRSTVERLLDSPELRGELSQRLRGSIDNRGMERIARRIEDLLEET